MDLLIGCGAVDAKSSSAISFFSRLSARMGLRLNGGVKGETPSSQLLAPSSSILFFQQVSEGWVGSTDPHISQAGCLGPLVGCGTVGFSFRFSGGVVLSRELLSASDN